MSLIKRNYTDEQIDYWLESYGRKKRMFLEAIKEIDNLEIRSAFLKSLWIFDQIKTHLHCFADFLQILEEKQS